MSVYFNNGLLISSKELYKTAAQLAVIITNVMVTKLT